MKTESLLDSFALLKFFQQESGFERVRHRLSEAKQHQKPLLMCELNVGEVFYVIGKRHGIAQAESILAQFPTLPIHLIPATWDIVLQAARLKAQYALSYADCIAAACAISHRAALVTGDKEFKALEHLLPIEWV